MRKLLIITFIFLISCSTQQKKEHIGNTVDLGFDSSGGGDGVDISSKKSVGQYGPTKYGTIDSGEPVEKKKYYALIIGPGMFASAQAISFLKCAERVGAKFNIISGFGFGSIVAAMYSQGDSLESMEWKLFNFFGKKNRFLTKLNSTKLKQFINKSIDIKKVKRSNLSLWLPKYTNNSIKFSSKFDLYNALEQALEDEKSLELLSNTNQINWSSLPTNKNVFLMNFSEDIELKHSQNELLPLYKEILYKFNNVSNPDIISFKLNKVKVLDEYSQMATSTLSKTQCLDYASKFWNN